MFPRNQSPRRRVMHENSELTNHDCFANVFRERGFRKFSTAQIGKLLQEEYPNFSLGSILPNDHAKGDAASCWCVGTPPVRNSPATPDRLDEWFHHARDDTPPCCKNVRRLLLREAVVSHAPTRHP